MRALVAPGCHRAATRERPGSAWLSRSSILGVSSGASDVKPVMLPPGRARLATSPSPTGSDITGTTIGIVRVACWAARACGVAKATMRSTFMRTRSFARLVKRSCLPSADRYSMMNILPLDIAQLAHALQEGIARLAKFGRVERCGGQETDARHFRRLLGVRRKRPRQRRAAKKSDELPPLSFNHLISPREKCRRDGQAERLGSLEVDHELKFGGLLDRQISRLRTHQYQVHLPSGTPV